MKRLLISAALGVILVASTTPRASAWGLFHCCCNCCSTICCKQYNAFTPCCFGTICCNGCCPIGCGTCGPNVPGPCGPCGYGPGCGYGGGWGGYGPGWGGYGGGPAFGDCDDCGGGTLLGQLPAPPPTPYSGGKPPAGAPPAGAPTGGPNFQPPMPGQAPTPSDKTSLVWPASPTFQAGYFGYGR
jgi:hypothetical protein